MGAAQQSPSLNRLTNPHRSQTIALEVMHEIRNPKNLFDNHAGSIRLRSSVVPGKSGPTFRICFPA
jgi:hypothetical protein